MLPVLLRRMRGEAPALPAAITQVWLSRSRLAGFDAIPQLAAKAEGSGGAKGRHWAWDSSSSRFGTGPHFDAVAAHGPGAEQAGGGAQAKTGQGLA